MMGWVVGKKMVGNNKLLLKKTKGNNSITANSAEELFHGEEMSDVDPIMVDEQSKKSQSEISDNTYQAIAQRIVDITEDNLITQDGNKEKLRKPLQSFIMALLSLQFVVLVFVLFLNDSCLHLETDLVKTYIVSVFAETLLGLTIMISFAFSNKEEVQLISILNSVISDFKVFGSDQHPNGKK